MLAIHSQKQAGELHIEVKDTQVGDVPRTFQLSWLGSLLLALLPLLVCCCFCCCGLLWLLLLLLLWSIVVVVAVVVAFVLQKLSILLPAFSQILPGTWPGEADLTELKLARALSRRESLLFAGLQADINTFYSRHSKC